MTPNENVNHTRGRLNKDEFDADDLGPSRAKHRSDYHYRSRAGAIPYRVLSRMLKAGVGKPWKDTHSKLSNRYDRRTDVGSMVWDHLNREVDDNAFIGVDGAVYHHSSWHDFYVDPTNGNLCQIPKRRFIYKKPVNPDEIVLDKHNILLRQAGIWYRWTYEMVEESFVRSKRIPNPDPVAAVKNAYVYQPYVVYEWVRKLKVKHQLNHKELAKAKLVNTPELKLPSHRERAARKRAA